MRVGMLASLMVLVLGCGATTTGTRADATGAEDTGSLLDVARGVDTGAADTPVSMDAYAADGGDAASDILDVDVGFADATDACIVTCSGGQTNCGCACTDLMSDNNHCGACGSACCPGAVCIAGQCGIDCPSGLSACPVPTSGDCVGAATCRNLQTDLTSCGACNVPCPSGSGCVAGVCVGDACPVPTTLCGGRCSDLQTDASNCGACGHACCAGSGCAAGRCTFSCVAGQTGCGDPCAGGACRDLATDNTNCGACGSACCPGDVCSRGECLGDCPASLTSCPGPTRRCGVCANTAADPMNCGLCGHACAAGEGCILGTCTPHPDIDAGARDASADASVTCAPRPWSSVRPGACDAEGRTICSMWAASRVTSGVAYGQCTTARCVAATRCEPPLEAPTCYCGDSPACGPDEVCAAPGPGLTPRCRCGATP